MSSTSLTLQMLSACSFPILHGCRQRGNLVGLVIWNTRWFLMSPNQSQSLLVYWSLIRYTAILFLTTCRLHMTFSSCWIFCFYFFISLCVMKFHWESSILFYQGIALRGLFIIDKEGVIQHSTINNLGIGRSVDETLRTLQVDQQENKCIFLNVYFHYIFSVFVTTCHSARIHGNFIFQLLFIKPVSNTAKLVPSSTSIP